jgi:hypothetical protein
MNKITFILLTTILLLFVSCRSEIESDSVEESNFNNSEIIQPTSESKESKVYNVVNFEFELPKSFLVKKINGPDFQVYYCSYPGGIGCGIYFGQYPSLPSRIKDLTSNNPMMKEMRTYPGDPMNLVGPMDSLELNCYYHELYENEYYHPIVNTMEFDRLYKERDFMTITHEEREKFLITDSLHLEAIRIDTNYIWKSYPLINQFGNYDVLFTDNEEYGWRTHFFTEINSYATLIEVHKFVNQLIESKNTP